MSSTVHPALVLIFGAAAVALARGKVRQALLLLFPAAAFGAVLLLGEGTYGTISFLDQRLVVMHVDRLSLAFGYIFTIISFLAALYAVHVQKGGEHAAGLVYAGSALGAVFAGDLLTLFVFWEIMAVSATYLIWAGGTAAARAAGLRYLLVHLVSGLFLLVGIVLHVAQTGSIAFGYLGLTGAASYFVLAGFGINAAFPLLHAWLPDAYPEASFSGTVFLSAFTTKTAVYVLARAFPGEGLLIWIGAAMTAFPIFYAVIENNLRKVLSYSLINQVGFMVCGVGIGTKLALNGTVAHAFAHILYKALLFMSMGAVIHQTGRINATDLGGLYKSMPLTAAFCIIGAASISGFPLTSGFVSKSMIVSAAGGEHLVLAWFALIFASAGVFHHSGIKIPFFAFFSHDAGIRTTEPPKNMLAAMGIAAFLCLFIGIFPGFLYAILPFPVEYVPYTASHVVDQLQLLLFSALAFTLLMLSGNYPAEMRALNLDVDWFYRKGADAFLWALDRPFARLGGWISRTAFETVPGWLGWASKNPPAVLKMAADSAILPFADAAAKQEIAARIKKERSIYPGDIIKHRPIGWTVFWATLFLLVYLLTYYLAA